MAKTGTASLTIAELREFASFTPCEQRYIKRSLDVGLGRQDAFKLWARDAAQAAHMQATRSNARYLQDSDLPPALAVASGCSEALYPPRPQPLAI